MFVGYLVHMSLSTIHPYMILKHSILGKSKNWYHCLLMEKNYCLQGLKNVTLWIMNLGYVSVEGKSHMTRFNATRYEPFTAILIEAYLGKIN